MVVISPDTMAEHRSYALRLFGEEFPYLFVPDPKIDIAKRLGVLRKPGHPKGWLYYRSLWIINRQGMIKHKSVPWNGTRDVEQYEKLFRLIGGQEGTWIPLVP